MRYPILLMSAFGLALFVSVNPASADEVEDLERMALALKMEAAELFAKGHEDEAHSLEREAEELLVKVRQLQSAKQEKSTKPGEDREKKSDAGDPESQHLKQLLHERLQDLREARKQAEAKNATAQELDEIREQISQTERKLAHFSEPSHPRQKIPPQFRAQAEKLEHAARRLQHIRVAAENLKAAEMHDMAHELMKKAEGMEHEMQAAKMKLAKLMQDGKGKEQEPGDELQQLRSENEQLRREMKELKEVIGQLRKDSDADK